MKHPFQIFIYCALIAGMFPLNSCSLLEDPNAINTKAITGFWELGAGNNYPNSLRNFQYRFEMGTEEGSLEIVLESPDTDVSLWLYDPLGQLVGQRWGARTATINADELRAGTYLVIAGTNERNKSGSFTLDITGPITDPVVNTGITKTTSGSWLTNGGGNNYPGSFRNHRYEFEVTESNTSLDVVMESTGADLSLWLFDPLGQQVGQRWGSRTTFMVEEARTGKYTLIAGTNERDVINAQYDLNVNGKITDLIPVPSQDVMVEGNITNGGGNNLPNSPQNVVYTFDVTHDNSTIDVIMESPDFDISLWVFNDKNEQISQRWGARTSFVVAEAQKGQYRIVCGTNQSGKSGKFKLSLVGEFSNFKQN